MNLVYLTARALHVLLGALWVGSVFFMVYFLSPAMAEAGPDGARVMAALMKRRVMNLIPVIALSTIVLGLWLYWRFTGGFDPAVSGSPAGMVFGAGGLIAIIAVHIGILGMRRNTLRAMAQSKAMAAMPDGPQKSQAMAAVQEFRSRAGTAGRITMVLLMVTTVLMAVGHYVG
jgi:uncharacterized membrane protein